MGNLIHTEANISLLILRVVAARTLGAVSLLFGFLVRISALGNFIVMSGALVVHFKDGWGMNWYGKKNAEGIEYFVLILCILFVLMLDGGGLFSFDRFLMNFFCY